MRRRTFLKAAAMAAVAAGSSACASRRAALPVPAAGRRFVALPPASVAWDRVIRTTVGLRPFRATGFVLRAERLDDKLLVHNYGHGGSGMSLSWGTGLMAAELAMEGAAHRAAARRAAVIGCGMVGLTTARQLQRRGFDVTIYASRVPPDTTSNMSLAGFTPTSGLVTFSQRTPEWEAQFRRAVVIAYEQHQLLAGPHYGVSWINRYALTEDPASARGGIALLPDSIRTEQVVLGPGEHPFPSTYAIESPFLRFEPSIYLDALMRDVEIFGGHIVIRRFEAPRDLMSLSEPVVVNCTGLGARALFGDEDLTPLKGQLTVVVPQPEVQYGTTGGLQVGASESAARLSMMPRSDGLVLGGTSEAGIGTLEVNEAERTRIVEGHIELFKAMRARHRETAATLQPPPEIA